ncbi:MAG: polyprenyl synthetase family protein [Pigmentiphaga sp.]|nr:polyprenyl synthetase family protein [Pigmentiphaga sp.]
MNRADFQTWMQRHALHVEQVLSSVLPGADQAPVRLHEAMRYAALGGGKRVRPLLVYAAAEACLNEASADATLDPLAAAVELIHVYSLVHDDLPCMDDDAMRRGKPTVHVQYDEACALLVGDALQALAFESVGRLNAPAERVVEAMQVLARASGSLGMVGGQAIDLASVGLALSPAQLETMHRLKTGALLQASTELGGIAVGADPRQRQSLAEYAKAIGLAFQVIDDILDVTADTARLGKTAGKDEAADKPTYVSLLGLDQARALASALHRQAVEALGPFGSAAHRLTALADFVVLRDR